MTNAKTLQTISKRQRKQKEQVIEKLKKVPIVEIACKQIGIARSTYYRWRKEDQNFTQLSDDALRDGRLLINDLAESKLLSAIRDQHMTGIIFWLKHNHPSYTTRIEISEKKDEDPNLTPEQQVVVQKALELTRPPLSPVIRKGKKQ